MANPLGTFDKDLVAVAWFDVTQQPAGWFSSGCVTTESGAPAGVDATVALTETGDSLAASGSVNLAATTTLTESSDTASGQGVVAVSASAALTQGADTVSSTAAVAVSASTALNESGDTLTASSAVAVTGSTTLNEGADTSTATGAVVISVTGVLAEGADSVTSTGPIQVSGAVALGESADTISATGNVVSGVTATAALLEAADSLSSAAAVGLAASCALSESSDTLTASATVVSGVVGVDANIALVESDDTLASAATVTSIPVGASEYPFFSKWFFSAGFFSDGFWGVATQPYVDLTHAERLYVRTLLDRAYVESSVAQIVIHAEKFNISVIEAIEQLRVKLKLKHDRVLTIFDEVTYISKRAEVRNEKQGDAAYVMLKNESFAVRTLRNEDVALFSKEQSLSAKTVFCEELVVSNRKTTTQVFTHGESMNLRH